MARNSIATTEEQMLISAERYALGRRTYIVGMTCGWIGGQLAGLSDWTLHMLEHDVTTATDYGMDMDHECWMTLLSGVREEMRKREKEKRADQR